MLRGWWDGAKLGRTLSWGRDAWPQVGWCQEGEGHFVFTGRGGEGEGARGWIRWRCSWDHLGPADQEGHQITGMFWQQVPLVEHLTVCSVKQT